MPKKLSLIEKQNILKDKNGNIEILSQYYKKETKRTFCKCICKVCGYMFDADWSNLNKGKGCPNCAGKTLTLEDRQRIIIEKGINATIIDVYSKVRGKTVKIKDTYCLCKCNEDGHVWEGLWGNLNRGRGCPMCSNSNIRYTIKDIQNKVNELNMNLTLLSTTIKKTKGHSKTFVTCKCNKDGHVWESQMSNLFEGKGCPVCSGSNMENITINVLNKMNIEFYVQHRFDDCRDTLPLPFDIYIKDLNIAIELDGIQHFEPTTFGGVDKEESIRRFKMNQKHDEIKNNYCKENNIKLIRIPYFNIDKIEDIIKQQCMTR